MRQTQLPSEPIVPEEMPYVMVNRVRSELYHHVDISLSLYGAVTGASRPNSDMLRVQIYQD